MHRVYKDGGKAASNTIVRATQLAQEYVDMDSKNVKLSERTTDMEVNLVYACAARSTLSTQLEVARPQISALEENLVGAGLALEILVSKTSQIEADL